jgi:hypothetical protein
VAAKRNAEMNGLGEKTEWLCGKAEDIFGGLPEKGFEGGESCVVVDVSGLVFGNPSSPSFPAIMFCHYPNMSPATIEPPYGYGPSSGLGLASPHTTPSHHPP